MTDPRFEHLRRHLSAGRRERDGLRAPYLDDFLSRNSDPEPVLAAKIARKRALEGDLRELRSTATSRLRESGGGRVLRSFRASEPPASDGSTDIRDLIGDEIRLLERQIDQYDRGAVAWSEAQAEHARGELPGLPGSG